MNLQDKLSSAQQAISQAQSESGLTEEQKEKLEQAYSLVGAVLSEVIG